MATSRGSCFFDLQCSSKCMISLTFSFSPIDSFALNLESKISFNFQSPYLWASFSQFQKPCCRTHPNHKNNNIYLFLFLILLMNIPTVNLIISAPKNYELKVGCSIHAACVLKCEMSRASFGTNV